MLALAIVFMVVMIGACYSLGGFVARRWPRLLTCTANLLHLPATHD
jgi:hypothetical protein